MSERRTDWPAGVPNVNPPHPTPFHLKSIKKGSHPALKCWLIIRLDDCIYYLLPLWADS